MTDTLLKPDMTLLCQVCTNKITSPLDKLRDAIQVHCCLPVQCL